MKVVSRRTGLTPHVIRVWERRYQAVVPERTESNRRLYSDQDIQRLQLLHRATRAGHSIGQIANLPTSRLISLVEAEARSGPPVVASLAADGSIGPEECLETCIEAVNAIDARKLETALQRAAVALSQPVLVDEVVLPLLREVGRLWQDGSIKIAHEHPASAVMRTFLGGVLSEFDPPEEAPVMVASTPQGQGHELGALVASLTAASQGWKVVYLGPDLPAEEIAAAAQRTGARLVALSLVYPPDSPKVRQQLKKLRRSLPASVQITVGGRGAAAYAQVLDAIGAITLQDIPSLRIKLEELRNSS
ncbi:MAG TPA: MerR family transcriptional regulator [Acidobacteriota bacterium]|nr:MerR family transcriptional regulator [Acidobacteriota bacterium]